MDGTAIVFCEKQFGKSDGKTANGLVQFTSRYKLLGVIDSAHAGKDAGAVLGLGAKEVPIFSSLTQALANCQLKPKYLVMGLAPDGGRLPLEYRPVIKEAIENGLSIDSGLHDYLGEDAEFKEMAKKHQVKIRDVRRPPAKDQLHFFSGKIQQIEAVKVVMLGTDSAIGKRTTALLLHQALLEAGIKSEFIGTGQTSWFQGAEYCIMLDALPNDFVTGEIEDIICQAWEEKQPEVIIIEGQGSPMHPAYPGGFELIAAARPEAIILQHAPKRKTYDGFPQYEVHPLQTQIKLINLLSGDKLVAVTLNHEGMTLDEVEQVILEYERELAVPVTDVLLLGCQKLVGVLVQKFPGLRQG